MVKAGLGPDNFTREALHQVRSSLVEKKDTGSVGRKKPQEQKR